MTRTGWGQRGGLSVCLSVCPAVFSPSPADDEADVVQAVYRRLWWQWWALLPLLLWCAALRCACRSMPTEDAPMSATQASGGGVAQTPPPAQQWLPATCHAAQTAHRRSHAAIDSLAPVSSSISCHTDGGGGGGSPRTCDGVIISDEAVYAADAVRAGCRCAHLSAAAAAAGKGGGAARGWSCSRSSAWVRRCLRCLLTV